MRNTIESDRERYLRESLNMRNSALNEQVMSEAAKYIAMISKPAILINTTTGEATMIDFNQAKIDCLIKMTNSALLPITHSPQP